MANCLAMGSCCGCLDTAKGTVLTAVACIVSYKHNYNFKKRAISNFHLFISCKNIFVRLLVLQRSSSLFLD